MTEHFESERREFCQLAQELTVRYKYLSREFDLRDKNREGVTTSIGGAGLLLNAEIPKAAWYQELLRDRIVVGLNVLLPSEAEPIRALGRVLWLESLDEHPGRVGLGIKFHEIERAARDSIIRYVVRSQLR